MALEAANAPPDAPAPGPAGGHRQNPGANQAPQENPQPSTLTPSPVDLRSEPSLDALSLRTDFIS